MESTFSKDFIRRNNDMRTLNIVTIGGGGGHSQILSGLKKLKNIRITAIVPVTDSGRSTGVLHREYQTSKSTGDLTKCMAALCDDSDLASALMNRFQNGPLENHSLKNLMFAGLEKSLGLGQALKVMHKWLDLEPHQVIPVSMKNSTLVASFRAGNKIVEETNLDTIANNPLWNPNYHAIKKIWLEPSISSSLEAKGALRDADYIVLCPGDLFTSIIPVLLVSGIKQLLIKSPAKIIALINIMTKAGETDNFGLKDFVVRMETYLGRKLNKIVCNNKSIPPKLVNAYKKEHKVALVPTVASAGIKSKIVSADLLTISEGFVRHDPEKCAQILNQIFFST